jgi:undecaprenyl-diphosphatase
MLTGVAVFLATVAVLWALIHLSLPLAWRAARSTAVQAAQVLLRRRRVAAWYGRGAAWMAPLHPYRPLALVALLGFLAAGATGAVFVELAERVSARSEAMQSLDERVWSSARAVRTPGANTLFVAFTLLGTPVGWAILVLPAAAVLAARRRPGLALYLVVAGLGAWGLNHALKLTFARARPDLAFAVRPSSGFSFPSGHAMMAVVVAGALVYVVMRLPTTWRMRSGTMAVATALAAAIAASRVYLGVHWLSDIVAGMAAGLVWLAAITAAYEIFRRVRSLREMARLSRESTVPAPKQATSYRIGR